MVISKDYSQIYTDQISNDQTSPSESYLYNGKATTLGGGTSHLSIIDKYKNSVSLTTTINGLFGSKVISETTGIIYNNQMNDFSINLNVPNQFGIFPSPNNMIAPQKRPLSSMSPIMIFDSVNITHALGGSGGPTIISAVLQCLIDLQDNKYDERQTIETLRVHSQLFPRIVQVEAGMGQDVINFLIARGHNVTVQSGFLSDGQSGIGNVQIASNYGPYDQGYSDIRKLGVTEGY